MFIINPDPYLKPSYRISPFQTAHIVKNMQLKESTAIDGYFTNRFGAKYFSYFYNGRAAINYALSQYNLDRDDVITIITTSDNFYISNCVTEEIEKFCTWSREITDKTKILFVNHEFGFPYAHLEDLRKYKLPIIEDCAHSFFSSDRNNAIGKVGDFVIYSFPKMFPVQFGGLLVSNGKPLERENHIKPDELRYLKKVLSHHSKQENEIKLKRIENYTLLKKELADFGFTERFKLNDNSIPGVYMFTINNEKVDVDKLKVYMHTHGIESSVFYGERAFFLPCHQNLQQEDLLYFKSVLNSYLLTL